MGFGLSQLDLFLELLASGIIIVVIVIFLSSFCHFHRCHHCHIFRPNKADLEDAMMELVDIDINEDNLDFSQVIIDIILIRIITMIIIVNIVTVIIIIVIIIIVIMITS